MLALGSLTSDSGTIGQKVYLEFTYRWPRFFASTLVAVHAIVLGFTASNCIVFGEYVLFALGRAPAEHPVHVRLLAVALMTGVTVLHGCFLRTGIVLQNILGWVKIGLVIFMTLASGAVVIGRYKPGEINVTTGLSNNSPFPSTWDGIWEGSVWNWGIVSTALFKVFYSYAGLQNVNNVLNEVRDPVRTLRSAAPTALATACLLYLLINVAYFLVIPLDEIKESGELVAALFFQRVFGHTLGKLLLPLAVAVSAAGNVMVVTFALVCLPQIHRATRASGSSHVQLGPPQPGDCTPGPPPLWRDSFFISPIWSAVGRPDSALHSFGHRYIHSVQEHLLIHPQCGGLPRPSSLARNLARSASAAMDTT